MDGKQKTVKGGISIHAPRAGRDCARYAGGLSDCEFQSTRPVRGATAINTAGFVLLMGFQSTRPVRGATRGVSMLNEIIKDFNPRAPCGARRTTAAIMTNSFYFNPRAPCGARLQDHGQCYFRADISIHAPRAGRDCGTAPAFPFPLYFNPRAPCGARLKVIHASFAGVLISIHAPRAGRDFHYNTSIFRQMIFQSTRPVRGATPVGVPIGNQLLQFQSTRPVRGATSTQRFEMHLFSDFNPRAPCGARQRGGGLGL